MRHGEALNAKGQGAPGSRLRRRRGQPHRRQIYYGLRRGINVNSCRDPHPKFFTGSDSVSLRPDAIGDCIFCAGIGQRESGNCGSCVGSLRGIGW